MPEPSISSEDSFHKLFDLALDCLLILDMTGRIVEVNESGLAARGYAREEMVGRRISEFDPPEFAVKVPERMTALFRDGHARFESAHVCKDGRVMPVEINSRLIEWNGQPHVFSVIRDITSMKLQEAALKASEERWKFALEGAGDGVWDVNLLTNEAVYSKRYKEMLGYTEEEFAGLHEEWVSRIHPDDLHLVNERIDAYYSGKTPIYSNEYRLRCKDGSYKWIHARGMLVSRDSDDQPLRMIGTHTDITERKISEELLRNENEKNRIFMQASFDGIHILDTEGYVIEVNDAFCNMLGYDRAELLTMNVAQWDVRETPVELKQGIARLLNHGEIFETRHRRKDGAIIHVEISARAISYKGQTVLWNSSRDISERRQAELLVLESATRLYRAELVSKAGSWELDIKSQKINASDGAAKLYGIDRNHFEHADVQALVLPEYRPLLDAALRDLIENNAFYDVVFKIKTADSGEIKDLRSIASYDEDKGIAFGTIRDISERVKAEESLRLAGMVYENSAEAITVTDADNNIIAVNPAFTETTGYSAEEVIGKNPRVLSSGRQDQAFYREMWRQLNSTGKWQGEIWNRRKNGEVYAEQLSINTIYTPEGKVHRRIALFLDVTEKKKSDEIIWKQANFDVLTGLPNRRMLYDRLAQDLKKAHRSKEKLALLFIDLDRFKEVNDTLGHNVGDDLLIEAGNRLGDCVRDTDTVARLGGDEFMVILTQIREVSDIDQIAREIIKSLAKPYSIGSELVIASASVGITVYPEDSLNIDHLVQFADQAMYEAKEQGRSRYCYFTIAMQNAAQSRLRLITELRDALPAEQLRVYFQPIVELESGRIFKAEALLRWQHPQRGLVSPMVFIPLAEETGLIIEIGSWVFHQSAQWAAKWDSLSRSGFQISVNKSPVQFQNKDGDEGIAWPDYLHELGLTGRNIAIEITEGLLLNQDDSATRKLFQFRDAGMQVSIDDFGTGYSALSYLKKFDIDYLKIDQSFVRNIISDPADQALCEAIVVMAHKLGLKVIAEGVETKEQRDLLLKIGCDFAQGYLFGKPMPGEEMDALLRSCNTA